MARRQQTKGNDMTNAINDAIANDSAHNLASALADVGVTATRSGALHSSSEACEIAGYGTAFATSEGWQVRDMDGCEGLVDNDELAEELAEVVAMTKQVS